MKTNSLLIVALSLLAIPQAIGQEYLANPFYPQDKTGRTKPAYYSTDPFDREVYQTAQPLRHKPRFGMTEAELTQLWGTPTQVLNWTLINPMIGVKKEYQKYLPQHLFARVFKLDKLSIHVSFYKNRAFVMTIFDNTYGKTISAGDFVKIAALLCKTWFTDLTINEKGHHAVYSKDSKQQYMLQYQGDKCTIVHLPSWIQFNKGDDAQKEKIQVNSLINIL